ncbi:MAG: type II toxin-antitoxin system RelB/DinJ family antitoxin [Ignavibacteriaceae bacterium]|nr:type II toxin-antitoxin system RelB/DinJ family antitoxin [Ignavibacteriaceae bacterium]
MKDSMLTIRIDSDVKKEAEEILKKIGLNSSNAIGLFYNSIIINKGIPFKLRLDTVPAASISEQKDIEKILNKRTKKDKEIIRTESYIVEL